MSVLYQYHRLATNAFCSLFEPAISLRSTSFPSHIYTQNLMVVPLIWILNAALVTVSPWASSEWRINFSFGRNGDTDTGIKGGDGWGESGARLALGIDVLVESTSYPDSSTERDFMGGSGASNCLSVLDDAYYVTSEKGQQSIRFGPTGAWKLSSRRTGRPGDASVIRFWIDVLDTAIRNDVSLNSGERLFATANCWREVDFEIGRKRLRPYIKRAEDIQNAINARLEHTSGDRRLDGTDFVDTALGSIDMAVLLNQRDEMFSELRKVQQTLPGTKHVSNLGHWPGTTEKLVIAEGKVGVKRRKGIWEEFLIVGTWTASSLNVVADTYYDELDDITANLKE
jgi:hypothetical protein